MAVLFSHFRSDIMDVEVEALIFYDDETVRRRFVQETWEVLFPAL